MKRKMRKVLITMLLVALFVGNIPNTHYVTAFNKQTYTTKTITDKFPLEVKSYAENKLQDVLQLLSYYADTFEVNEAEIAKI